MRNVGTGARCSQEMPNSARPSRMVTTAPRSTCTSRTTMKTRATATRIQNVAGMSSRLSSARLRATSVSTLMTDMAEASSRPTGDRARAGISCSSGYQLDWSQQSRRHGLHTAHILRLESLTVFGIQRLVVWQRPLRQQVHRGIGHHDANGILPILHQPAYIHLVRRAPHCACTLAIHVYYGGLAHRPFVHRPHAGARSAFLGGHGRAFAEGQVDQLSGDVRGVVGEALL